MTDTPAQIASQEQLDDDDYFIACPAQQEVLLRFNPGGELEIRQQDALGNDSAVYVGEDNVRSFLGCIISRYRKEHGKHAAADLASYLCDVAGVPSTRDLDYGEPLIATEPPPAASRSKNAERQRRYRERKRNASADDQNGERNSGRNAAPLQPELLSS
ncbi:hypothetical protein [Bradyrhizobium sp. RDI18]|uniref:hypothetical protein n=1 Tax=Bradyrhizobium sp. RDI18 TaxID=3367400 RepID=UPI003721A1CD